MKVFSKARKHYPSFETKYSVNINRNESIQILVNGGIVNQFKLGDTATYNSYNLIYMGIITKITDKVVQITAYPGSRSERRHNLDLYTFCWRNEKFNVVEATIQNGEAMYYL